jgi:formate-dependent nitrite reductase cytochrome c552 subunit
MAEAREHQRPGQLMIDFIMAENSKGFHPPGEALRILGDAINYCRSGHILLHTRPALSPRPPNRAEKRAAVPPGRP